MIGWPTSGVWGGVAGLVRGVTGEGVKREGEEISRKGGLSGHPE